MSLTEGAGGVLKGVIQAFEIVISSAGHSVYGTLRLVVWDIPSGDTAGEKKMCLDEMSYSLTA